MQRQSGILMPIFSLPSKYGVGDFGKEGYKFVDYLKSAGQKIWQLLPLVQTGYGDSPYSSIASDSFNPYFISPELLIEDGLITKEETEFAVVDRPYIDYGELYNVRFPMLRKAFTRFNRQSKEFLDYLDSKESLNYALFMALKYQSGQKHFYHWENKYKFRNKEALERFAENYKDEIEFWQFIQFTAKNQWLKLKAYANKKGIKIVGDMPLYVALDSVDVWVHPELYKLDDNFVPKKVAGVPPDYFCQEGQLWGNPVYDYEEHEKDDFKWWTNRLKKALSIYDYVRIDHFRGLDRYYEVENGAPNAIIGEWVDVPHEKFFTAVHKVIDKDRIIAEDLGIIDDGVIELLKDTGYPGMKILSFAFNGDRNNFYLPYNIEENSVCYTGTHDNDTLRGLIEKARDWDYKNLVEGVKYSQEVLEVEGETDTVDGLIESIIELGLKCKANLFVLPFQDLLGLGTEYRVNEPGTIKKQNWSVKFKEEDFSVEKAKWLNKLTKKYKR